MKFVLPILSCVLLAVIISCAGSQEVTSFWRSPDEIPGRTYRSIFVMAIANDRAARSVVETDLAIAAKDRGITAIRSVDYFPGTFTEETAPSKEEIVGKVEELGCDGIFTISLLDVKSDQRYVPGTTTYGYDAWYRPRYEYYGQFYSYYRYTYPMVVTPGYYTTDNTYFIESNLYDAKTGQLQWSMQSRAYNPDDLDSFSAEYTQLLMKRIDEEKTAGSSK